MYGNFQIKFGKLSEKNIKENFAKNKIFTIQHFKNNDKLFRINLGDFRNLNIRTKDKNTRFLIIFPIQIIMY